MSIDENVSLSRYTTLKIGGNARYFCVVRDVTGLREVCDFARDRQLPIFVLGGGSNVLISDRGFNGLVIKNEILGVTESMEKKSDGEEVAIVEAGAGVGWDDLVALCVEKGHWGMENLSAIPGTVGAAPVQNIGAYGAEVKDVIQSVTVFDSVSGEEKLFSAADCKFGYRESVFKRPESKNLIITSVVFRLGIKPAPNLSYKDLAGLSAGALTGAPMPTIAQIRAAVIKIRAGKFPDLRITGTAGSFWKNPVISVAKFRELTKSYPLMPSFPVGGEIGAAADVGSELGATAKVKVPLAWILDNVCGLKGFSKGNVGLYKNQPLVLVANQGATADEVNAFAGMVFDQVKDKTGIEIEREVNSIS